jgi:mannose-6-phosphate isomerase-like protein (cupin superfamily)
MVVNRESAPHYNWGEGCDGSMLSPGPDLNVIEERMPPHTAEKPHHHTRARQFFFVLSGSLCMELEGQLHSTNVGSGIEIAPMALHQARNITAQDVRFLVVSSPTTRGDWMEGI